MCWGRARHSAATFDRSLYYLAWRKNEEKITFMMFRVIFVQKRLFTLHLRKATLVVTPWETVCRILNRPLLNIHECLTRETPRYRYFTTNRLLDSCESRRRLNNYTAFLLTANETELCTLLINSPYNRVLISTCREPWYYLCRLIKMIVISATRKSHARS